MNSIAFKRQVPALIAMVVLMLLSGLIGISYKIYSDDKLMHEELTAEIEPLRQKVTTLKANANLPKDQIADYNKVLTQLIPEKEDFFTIIYALEQLSQQTGFIITGYAINLSATTKEKYSIVVQGDGDSAAFLKFLKTYQFAGGRLVTNEKIEFSSDAVGKVKLSLNFYNKKIPTEATNVVQITNEDLKKMDEIRNKTTILFKSDDSATVQNYETKANPF